MYRITYTKNNGYSCSCCREEWQGHKDFITLEEAKKFYLSNFLKDDPDAKINLFTNEIPRIKNDYVEFNELLEIKVLVGKVCTPTIEAFFKNVNA